MSCLGLVGGKTDFPLKFKKVKKELTLTPVWEITTTVSQSSEGEMLARRLVESRYAACVQIHGPIQSVYHWQGQIQNETEWKITIKTHVRVLDQCMAILDEFHPYDVPEILARPVERVSKAYLDWLITQTVAQAFHVRIQFDANPPTFEDVYDRLSKHSNVFIELDGSFVWRASIGLLHQSDASQIDGMLYDRAERMEYVELKGRCEASQWNEFVNMLIGERNSSMRIQDMASGQWMTLEAFSERWNGGLP